MQDVQVRFVEQWDGLGDPPEYPAVFDVILRDVDVSTRLINSDTAQTELGAETEHVLQPRIDRIFGRGVFRVETLSFHKGSLRIRNRLRLANFLLAANLVSGYGGFRGGLQQLKQDIQTASEVVAPIVEKVAELTRRLEPLKSRERGTLGY